MERNEKLVNDVKALIADLEDILDEVKDKTSNEISELHTSLVEKLATAKEQLIRSEKDLLDKKEIGTKMTNEYVHSNAWKIAIIAAVMGFLIGYTI